VVVQALRYQHDQGRVNSLAYIVMPDHLHWLVVLRGDTGLDALMHSIKSYTSHRLGQEVGKPLWQTGYHDRALRGDEGALREAARYLVANPLRAGLADTVEHYPHWDAVWLEGGVSLERVLN